MNLIFDIRTIRIKQKISVHELAKKIEIDSSYLIRLENNLVKNPNLNTLIAIAEALEVDVKDLFYTDWDVPALEEKLYLSIEKYGTTSEESVEAGRIIDLLSAAKIKSERDRLRNNRFFK